VATTPPGWCHYSHPQHLESNHLKIEPDKDSYVPYFANQDSKPCYGPLAPLVHEILYNGWGFLSRLQGCEWLKDEVERDPEIAATVASFRG
jgi:hypothetical protein